MIFSRTAEYAIRAMVYMAELPDQKYAMVREIADHEKIPTHFLAKILQQLARQGMLRSSKGPTGGFQLRRPAEKIRLLDVITALDGAGASEDTGFPDHRPWKALRSRIMDYLRRNTIATLAHR